MLKLSTVKCSPVGWIKWWKLASIPVAPERLAAEIFWIRHLEVPPLDVKNLDFLQVRDVRNPFLEISSRAYTLSEAIQGSDVHALSKSKDPLTQSLVDLPLYLDAQGLPLSIPSEYDISGQRMGEPTYHPKCISDFHGMGKAFGTSFSFALKSACAVSTWSVCPIDSHCYSHVSFQVLLHLPVLVATWWWGSAPLNFPNVSLVHDHFSTLK